MRQVTRAMKPVLPGWTGVADLNGGQFRAAFERIVQTNRTDNGKRERPHPKTIMAAVLDDAPRPDQTTGDATPDATPVAPTNLTPVPSGPGLKPIERLTSDTRYAKIIPESDQLTVLKYSSSFARNYIRSDYNFCASKIAVARGGKLRALDIAMRETSEWFTKAIAWVEQLGARNLPFPSEQIELEIKRPLAGQLVRCLTQYDRLFVRARSAVASRMLSEERYAGMLANAEKKLTHIRQLCIPDNDQYDFDGTRREG
ncbi:hypothetical protein C7402_103313 [Paraburkholderia unamae]|uniref:DUF1845 domain-containing protein n=2 Tax=Paraburkholderia unamae TaxID=219649 RepID=A0ABX5KW73_9BURK|nr:hypothetical protein C7402_103313 [Paraburkholderia unamae]